MSNESSYELVGGFSPKFRIRGRVRVWVVLGLPVLFFPLRLNILTHYSFKL